MRISSEKKERISEQILGLLFSCFPKSLFTAEVARDLARDEEFIKRLLSDLSKQGLVVPIKKNSQGIPFSKRVRWRISNKAYEVYKQHQ